MPIYPNFYQTLTPCPVVELRHLLGLFRNRNDFLFKYKVGNCLARINLDITFCPFECNEHKREHNHVTDKQPSRLFVLQVCLRCLFNFHNLYYNY